MVFDAVCQENALLISIKVTPRAKNPGILVLQPEDTALRLAVKEPAEDGKANAAVIALLAKVLAVPKRQITIASGTTSRNKRVKIECVQPETCLARLLKQAGQI